MLWDALLTLLTTALASYPAWRLADEVLGCTRPRCDCSQTGHFPAQFFDFLVSFFFLILAPGLNLILGDLLRVQSRVFLGLQSLLLTVMLALAVSAMRL